MHASTQTAFRRFFRNRLHGCAVHPFPAWVANTCTHPHTLRTWRFIDLFIGNQYAALNVPLSVNGDQHFGANTPNAATQGTDSQQKNIWQVVGSHCHRLMSTRYRCAGVDEELDFTTVRDVSWPKPISLNCSLSRHPSVSCNDFRSFLERFNCMFVF